MSGDRIARKIARAKVCHMSNAKWRKLFAALHELPDAPLVIGLKLINRAVLSVPTPGPDFEHDDNFGEYGGISYIAFSHIEWIGVSNSHASNSELISHLAAYGQFAIREEDEGILILGYSWD